MEKLKIYIGWDSKQPHTYDVAKFSIESRTKSHVRVWPIELFGNITKMMDRPVENRNGQLWCPISDAPMSTEFAISRFCIPFFQKEGGWAMFCDCDVICTTDIKELFDLCDDKYAVMVVKHKHEGSEDSLKMGGQIQTYYNRKNWSSVVLWNLNHEANKRFTLDNLNTWPGRDLHAFRWLEDDEIGELPQCWNYLVGVNKPVKALPKLIHYTLGTPDMEEYKDCYMADIWKHEYYRTFNRTI